MAAGQGTLHFDSGDRYEGAFESGMFHGQGCMFYNNGDAFDGKYNRGQPSGEGKFLFKDARVIINRNFQNGIERASTNELKNQTFEMGKKKNR